jgi:hypothetical protein
MVYHVVRRPLQTNTTNSSNQFRSGSVSPSTLMPRYHYSRTIPNNATNNNNNPTMTATTTTNNQPNSYGSFKSTIIPLVTNNRITTATPNKREFIQIPITREDGTSNTTNNQTRSVPISFISETNATPPTGNNNNNGNISPRPTFTNLLRPTSKYFQYRFNNSTEDPSINSNVLHLPSVSRRLSLTIPVTTTITTNPDDEIIKASSPIRQIPVRLPQTTTTTASSLPPTNPRISSAIHRSSPVSNALQRQKTDIGESSSSSPTLSTITNPSQTFDLTASSPIRRAEVMAREAIQGITRFQQQQRNGSLSSETTNNNNRSPTLSRRVIINLKNNQTVSLDSRLSSATKPPPIPSSSRSTQRNNLYHIPVLHEIQTSSHPETSILINNGNYKNEFHMEIPVLITTNNDQENQIENNHERLPLTNNNHSNQTLKSILKRSSSRETVSRKNVSFMNA